MSPKPYDQSRRNIKYELVLANYATKYYLKDEAGVDKLKRVTAQKMKFSIEYFFSKCDQIRKKLVGLAFG